VDTTVGWDDNLFRLPDGAPPVPIDADDDGDRGDLFVKAGAGAQGKVDFSRQSFQFDLNAAHYGFDKYSILDTWVYSGAADFFWVIGDRLKGALGYTRSERLPDFGELQFASDDKVVSEYGHFGIDWRMLNRLELRLLAEGFRYEHTDETRAELDNEVKSGTAGLFYVAPTGFSIGAQYRVAEGEYPNRQLVGLTFVDNKYEERESSLIVQVPFVTTGGFDLRVGYTQREHEDVVDRDFDGTTGRAQLRFAPSAKIFIDLFAYRELRAIEELAASYAVVNGASVGPAWALSSKVVLQAAYVYESRDFEGDPGFVIADAEPREDKTHIGRISLGYRPNYHFEGVLAFEHGKRDANIEFAQYDYNLVTLSLKAAL
jgi:exopolysaccharide biosynthesis operon protein EpsL